MESHVRPVLAPAPPFAGNLATRALGGRLPAPVDLRAAYAFARSLVALLPPVDRAGHRLVWVRGASYASSFVAAAPEAFVVVGRHAACDVCLIEDPFVALRHLLLRSVPLPSGGLALRVFDLHTGTGFVLEDGSLQSSMLAEGPVAFAVGEFAVVALPVGVEEGPLPEELPRVEHEASRIARDQLEALARAMSPYRASPRRDGRRSRVTGLPMPVVVGAPNAPGEARGSAGRFAISLRRAGIEASHTLTEEDLARGVILGRSERCASEALRRVTEAGTSRVHLLLVREGAEIHAYDLASTQGTFLGAARVRRARLPERGSTMLLLGTTSARVLLTWRAT